MIVRSGPRDLVRIFVLTFPIVTVTCVGMHSCMGVVKERFRALLRLWVRMLYLRLSSSDLINYGHDYYNNTVGLVLDG